MIKTPKYLSDVQIIIKKEWKKIHKNVKSVSETLAPKHSVNLESFEKYSKNTFIGILVRVIYTHNHQNSTWDFFSPFAIISLATNFNP